MAGHEHAAEVQVPDDFGDFYRQEYATMVALAYGMTADQAAAEEVAQEAFLRVLNDWDRVRAMSSPGGWVRVVTLNLARSRWRRLKSELAALARLGKSSHTHLDSTSIELEEFWSLVRQLPSRQAQVVALRYIEDMQLSEIASVLGIAEGSVKAHLHQARKRLGRQLEEKGWAADDV